MKKAMFVLISLFLAGLCLSAFSIAPLSGQDEDLKKMYAPILGEYEFTMQEGTFYLNFYIEEGALWADSGDGQPAVMEPIEDQKFEFKAEDPQAGVFIMSFSKDDQGEYTICQVVNEGMGLEIIGTKIK
jgi:cbb3-type cytochrome oxidase maturation protein